MKGPGYPAGVPNPFVMHVHPYPTRFHGAIYTRPVFGFPQIATASSVFIPPRDIDMQPDYPPNGYSGLGALAYNVGEGIFRPGGYGGGVFDGNLAGAPSLGHRSSRTLGDATPTPDDAANYPYGMYSAQTKQLQDKINQNLIAGGFCPIIADGKLGPATCGASVIAGPAGLTPMPSTCQDIKTVTSAAKGCGTGPTAPAASSSSVAKANLAPVTSSLPMISSSTKKVLGFIAGAAVAVGAVYYVKKRRG